MKSEINKWVFTKQMQKIEDGKKRVNLTINLYKLFISNNRKQNYFKTTTTVGIRGKSSGSI